MVTDRTILATTPHDLHRKRRSALNAYFSKQNLRQLEPVIQGVLQSLLRRMDEWAKEGGPINLNRPLRAATSDIIQAYAFGDFSERYLDMDDCNSAFFEIITPQPVVWSGLYFRWFMITLSKTPPSLVIKMQPRIAVFARWVMVRTFLSCFHGLLGMLIEIPRKELIAKLETNHTSRWHAEEQRFTCEEVYLP